MKIRFTALIPLKFVVDRSAYPKEWDDRTIVAFETEQLLQGDTSVEDLLDPDWKTKFTITLEEITDPDFSLDL